MARNRRGKNRSVDLNFVQSTKHRICVWQGFVQAGATCHHVTRWEQVFVYFLFSAAVTKTGGWTTSLVTNRPQASLVAPILWYASFYVWGLLINPPHNITQRRHCVKRQLWQCLIGSRHWMLIPKTLCIISARKHAGAKNPHIIISSFLLRRNCGLLQSTTNKYVYSSSISLPLVAFLHSSMPIYHTHYDIWQCTPHIDPIQDAKVPHCSFQ